MKTVFLISGIRLNVTTADEKYKPLRDGLAKKGYRIVPVDINWKFETVTSFTEKFLKVYESEKGEHNIIVGSSFGAVVAFVAANKTMPDLLILCSLSPYFKEDLAEEPIYKRGLRFGFKRLKDLENYSAKSIARNITKENIPTIMTYGSREESSSPCLVNRVKQTAKDIKQAKLFIIPNAPHSLSNLIYTQAIIDLL